MSATTPSAAPRPATPRPTWRVGLGVVVAAIGVSVLATGAVQAQIVPPADDELPVDRCIEAEVDEGATEAAATRRCVEDPEAFDRCMAAAADAGASVNQALDRCLLADAEVAPTTTAATTPTTATPDTSRADTDEPPDDGDGDSSGVPLPIVAGIAVVAAIIGAGLGLALRRPPSHPEPLPGQTAPSPPTTAPTPPTATGPGVDPDRATLVMALIETADVASSEAVRTAIAERLHAAGVEQVVAAPGEVFDPTAHRGVHAEEAPRPNLAGTVVRTDRPGWSDRGSVIRPPEVVVYRQDGSP